MAEDTKNPSKTEYEAAREKLEAARKQHEEKSPEQKRREALLKFGLSIMGRPQDKDKKAKGGVVSASKRADGIAQRGKTKGRMV